MLAGFEALLGKGFRKAEDVVRRAAPRGQADDWLEGVRHLHVVGLLVFLASGLGRDDSDETTPKVVEMTRAGTKKALEKIAEEKGIPVTVERAQAVIDLLLSGDLYGDLASGVAVVLHVIPGAPLNLHGDVVHLPQLIPALIVGVTQDLSDSPHLIVSVTRDLKDGRLDSRHRVMTHTLRVFFRLATAASLVETIRTLLGPDYQTFRLAVIVFAASQGIRLDEQDLDRLRVALDPSNPDLGPLLESAFSQLLARYPEARAAQRALQRLADHPSQSIPPPL